MNELTVIILSKEDEDVIADAVKSVKGFAHTILVIDGNSDRTTQRICEKLGATVVRNQFIDFSDQRNFGFYNVTTPWILYLDSDERVTPAFIDEVKEIIAGHDEFSSIGGYYVRRKTYYFGRDWNFQDSVQRLFVRNRFIEWTGVVHETPRIKGEFGHINSPIIHRTHRNLSQMVRKTNEWSEYEAKLRFDSGHPHLAPWRFGRVMGTEFFHSYVGNKGYKNGTYGIIEAMYQAFSIFITYAKLWEMQTAIEKKRK